MQLAQEDPAIVSQWFLTLINLLSFLNGRLNIIILKIYLKVLYYGRKIKNGNNNFKLSLTITEYISYLLV